MSKSEIQALPAYSRIEEMFHGGSHLIGFLGGLIGLFFLVFRAQKDHIDYWQLVSLLIYSLCLLSSLSSSIIYHWSKEQRRKVFFRKIDHCCIYLLIAGTYTPFLVNQVQGEKRTLFLILVWSVTLLGCWQKLFRPIKKSKLSALKYLVFGHLILFIWSDLKMGVSANVLNLIFYGGLCFSFGVIFYLLKRMKFHHVIWHLFVLAGCSFHYFAIYYSI